MKESCSGLDINFLEEAKFYVFSMKKAEFQSYHLI